MLDSFEARLNIHFNSYIQTFKSEWFLRIKMLLCRSRRTPSQLTFSQRLILFKKMSFFVTKPKNVERKERLSRAFEQKETKKGFFGANFIQMI